jgi:hypothetical protein
MSHVLEFEGARYNATGDLKVQGDGVQFQRDGKSDCSGEHKLHSGHRTDLPVLDTHIYVIR